MKLEFKEEVGTFFWFQTNIRKRLICTTLVLYFCNKLHTPKNYHIGGWLDYCVIRFFRL